MNAEFQVWVLFLGLVLGGAIAWVALGSVGRGADPAAFESEDERALEAGWLARELAARGHLVDVETVEAVLALHHDLAAGRAVAGPDAGEPSVRADEDRLIG